MSASQETQDYDAIIIGAGMSGLYQLYRLRELGMRVGCSRRAPASAARGLESLPGRALQFR